MLLLDLDGFKEINDRFGHSAGDMVLRIVAGRLCQNMRDADVAARLGGDEFGIVQLAADQPAAACRLAERVAAAIAEPMEVLGHRASVSSSIGIAVFPEHATDPDDLVNKADRALYAVK